MFDKILIANRGEIACRVARTARRMGIRTVAVYSDADARRCTSPPATRRDRIGPPPPRESYLDGDAIIAVAKATGAQAIHPGYGFLSENALFAAAARRAGIVFIGPPPAAIAAMGSKSEAKRIMGGASVPLVPGYHGDDQSPALLAREAAQDRLSRADQGVGRRRRQRHADRRAIRRFRRRACVRAARGAIVVRRRPRAAREIPDRAAPHRDPGVRGHARQRRVPVRARLLGAAATPEGARGGAGAGHEARAAAGRWARRRSRPRRPSATSAPARSNSSLDIRARRHVLLHGDEHAPAGRASGDRDDHRARSRRMAAARRGRRAAAAARRTSSRSTVTRSRRASTPRIRSAASCRRSAVSCISRVPRTGDDVASTRASAPATRSAVLRSDDRQADRARRGSGGGAAPAADALAAYQIVGVATNVAFLRRVVAHDAFATGQVDTGLIAGITRRCSRRRRRCPTTRSLPRRSPK